MPTNTLKNDNTAIVSDLELNTIHKSCSDKQLYHIFIFYYNMNPTFHYVPKGGSKLKVLGVILNI